MYDLDGYFRAAGGGPATADLLKSHSGLVMPGQVQSGETFDFMQYLEKSGGISAPSSGDMHIDVALTNISLAFMQDADTFVARQAFRSIPVAQRGNVYWTYPRGSFNRNQMQRRAPGTESQGANYEVDTAKYFCDVYALHVDIADQIRDNADAAFNLERDASTFLTMKSMLLEEIDWRDKFFSDTVVTAPGTVWDFVADGTEAPPATATDFDASDAANNGINQWSDAVSDPIEDHRRAKREMQQRTGFRPNIEVMGREVYDILLDHPDIIGRLDAGQTPNGPAMATKEALAKLFELDEIIVMDAIVNTAAVGLPDNHQFIGGKNSLLLYRPASPGLMTPAPGYTFLWSGFSGANSGGMRISNIRAELIRSDRIEIESAFEHNQVSQELGYFFRSIVG